MMGLMKAKGFPELYRYTRRLALGMLLLSGRPVDDGGCWVDKTRTLTVAAGGAWPSVR